MTLPINKESNLMKFLTDQLKLKSHRRGFSLPEVTMAVGIASMAIVLLLGLVPSGLSSIRDASITLGETRIFQQIVGEIQGADWGNQAGGVAGFANLNRYDSERRFYDDQGTPLQGAGVNSLRVSYVARIRMNASGGLVAVPGGQPALNMVAVTIDVAAVGDPDFRFDPGTLFKSHTVLVTRQF
jgi:uncharacterized protein (TIGR02598 family)